MKITIYSLYTPIEGCSQAFPTRKAAEKAAEYYRNMYKHASERDKEDYDWELTITPVVYHCPESPSLADLQKFAAKVVKSYFDKGW